MVIFVKKDNLYQLRRIYNSIKGIKHLRGEYFLQAVYMSEWGWDERKKKKQNI